MQVMRCATIYGSRHLISWKGKYCLERNNSVHSECHSELIRLIPKVIPNAPSRYLAPITGISCIECCRCILYRINWIDWQLLFRRGTLISTQTLLLALCVIAALHSPTAVSAYMFTAAFVDVPVVHYGMPTLPRASQCNVSRPKQVSQPIELREVATCHSVQRREAKAGVAINRTASAIAFDFGEANRGCTTLALALRSL
jgi:hypothetical protein